MKKLILWYPFFSMQDKDTLKFNLEADQNFRFMFELRKLLIDDFSIAYLLPNIDDTTNKAFSIYAYNELRKDGCIIIPHNFVPSNIGQRYDFNYSMMSVIIRALNPNIIFNNCDTISKNLKSIIDACNYDTKIFTFFHFLDIPELNMVGNNSSYFLRQVEAALASNAIGCYSQLNIDAFKSNAKRYFNLDINVPVDFYELVFSKNALQKELNNITKIYNKEKIIVFPNRLSSNNYSRHKEFFAAINDLFEIRKDFRVIITNPTGFISNDVLEQEVKPIIFPYGKKRLTRDEYLSVLYSSDYVCALFKEIHGGFAIRECIFCECLPIVPEINEYGRFKELYYKNCGWFKFVNEDLSNLKYVINYWLDLCVDSNILNNAKNALINISSIESNFEKLNNTLKSLL
jgi:hypothetical protein